MGNKTQKEKKDPKIDVIQKKPEDREELRHNCDLCGKKVEGVRYYCSFCDTEGNSYDICEGCEKLGIHPKTHKLTEVPPDQPNFVKYYENCAEALDGRLQVFREKRLFGILKNRKDRKEGDSPIPLDYLTSEEMEEIKMKRNHQGDYDQEVELDEDYVKKKKNNSIFFFFFIILKFLKKKKGKFQKRVLL